MLPSLKITAAIETKQFVFVKSARKTISIAVKKDCSVKICYGKHHSMKQVYSFVEQKYGWIESKINHVNALQNQQIICANYCHGGHVYLLGETFAINFISLSKSQKVGIFLDETNKICNIYCKTEADIERQMNKFLHQKAVSLLNLQIGPAFDIFKKHTNYTPSLPRLEVRNNKSKWGSLHFKKMRGFAVATKLSISQKLIHTPIQCFNYVMFHELCHLIHQNHSENFYTLQKVFVQDYSQLKKQLLLFV